MTVSKSVFRVAWVSLLLLVSTLGTIGGLSPRSAKAAALTNVAGAEWGISAQGGSQTSSWTINFNPGSTWGAGQPITIEGPSGTSFSSSAADYSLGDASTGGADCGPRFGAGDCSGLSVSGNQLTIDAPVAPATTNDDYRVYISNVTNPPPGSYAGSSFCVDDGYGQGCLGGTVTFSGVTLGLGASQAQPGNQVAVSGAVYGTSGPISNTTVNFSDGGAGGSFSPTPSTTDANGLFATTYTTGTTGGTVTLTATAPAASPSTATQSLAVLTQVTGLSFAVNPTVGHATGATWTTQFNLTSPLAQNSGTITITAPTGTTFPSPAADYTVNGTPAAQVTPGSSEVVVTTPVDLTAGEPVTIVATGVVNPAVGTYPASDLSLVTSRDTVPANPSQGFTLTPGSAAQLVFTGTADGPVGSTAQLGPVTVTVEDTYGNPVDPSADLTVNLSTTSSTGEFSGTPGGAQTTSLTIPTGQNSATFYYGDPAAGTWTLTAKATGLSSATLSSTTVPGPPAKIGFQMEPGEAVAGLPFNIQPIVAVEDRFGNVVTSSSALTPYDNVSASITAGTGAQGASLGGDSALSLDPFIPGEALFNNLSIDTPGPGYTLTATDDGLTAVSDPFDVAQPPTGISVSFSAPSVEAGGQITVQGTVTDGTGTGVANVSVEISDNFAGGSFASSGTGTTDVETGPTGSWTATYTAPTTSGLINITAGTMDFPPQETAPLTVTAAAPDAFNSQVFGPTLPVTASSGNVTLSAVLEDTYGNPVTGLTATDFSLGSSDPKVGALIPQSVTEAQGSPGTYSIVVTDTDADGGNAQDLTLVVEGVILAQPATVTISPAEPQSVTLVAVPQVAATGVQVAVTGSVLDTYGNPIPDVSLTLSDGLAGGSFTPSGPVTLVDGSFQTSYTTPGSTGTVTLTATTASLIEGTTSLTVKADATDPALSTVIGPGSPVTAGANDLTLTVSVVDQHGTAYSGLSLADFTVTSDDPKVGTVTPTSVTETSTPGTYTVILTDTDADLGATQTVSVSVDGVTLTQTAGVVVTPGPLASLPIASSSPWVAAGQSVTLTVTALDAFSNPLAGVPLTLIYTGDDGSVIGQETIQTGNDGTCAASFQAPATTHALTLSAETTPPSAVSGSAVLFVAPAGSDVTRAGGLDVASDSPETLSLIANGVTLTKITASGLTGALTVAEYGAAPDPVGGTLNSAGSFFDVHLGDASFTNSASVTIEQCAGASPSETLYWWNGSGWAEVSPAPTYDSGTGCLSLTITASTTPNLSDLGGTPFAVALPPSPASSGPSGSGSAVPAVSSVNLPGGPTGGGTTVTITGSGFTGATAVDFGTVPATSFSVDSDSLITVVSPPGQGTVDVTVTGPGGTSATSAGDRFTYAASSTKTFSDVPQGYWAYDAISKLVADGIVDGFPDGTFHPDAAVTRAEFVKMLLLALGVQPAADGVTPFTDVPSGSWYAPYVARALSMGMVEGITSTSFAPEATLTREAAAVLLARALKLTKTTPLTYKDAPEIDRWALAAVEQVVAAGDMQGYPDGTFRPFVAATRAEVAELLAKVLGQPSP